MHEKSTYLRSMKDLSTQFLRGKVKIRAFKWEN